MISEQSQSLLDSISLRCQSQRTASSVGFSSVVCGNDWDSFIEASANKCYRFLYECLGPFHKEPAKVILPMASTIHASGANASFSPSTGDIELSPEYVMHRPGVTLEKVCHEMLHANIDSFPAGDPFYEEGFVDYSVWVIAHAPYWAEYREDMIQAARKNIKLRQTRAIRLDSDYDRKRWAGGLFATAAYGPMILARLRQKKMAGDLTW